jgi:hypothetical protein
VDFPSLAKVVDGHAGLPGIRPVETRRPREANPMLRSNVAR